MSIKNMLLAYAMMMGSSIGTSTPSVREHRKPIKDPPEIIPSGWSVGDKVQLKGMDYEIIKINARKVQLKNQQGKKIGWFSMDVICETIK